MRCVSAHWQITYNMGNESFVASLWPCNSMQRNAMQHSTIYIPRYKCMRRCVRFNSKILFNECHGFIALARQKQRRKQHSRWKLLVFCTSFMCDMPCRRHHCQAILQLESVRENFPFFCKWVIATIAIENGVFSGNYLILCVRNQKQQQK